MSFDTAFQSFPQLETKNLTLRRLHLGDADALYQILSDDQVTTFYDGDPFTDLSQVREQIESWEYAFENRRAVRWGITRNGDGMVIGTCGYYGFHTWNLRASIGYELARDHWRQGIMIEALSVMIGYGFGEMALNRLEAVVMPQNIASIKMLEKLGFTNEGLLREYER